MKLVLELEQGCLCRIGKNDVSDIADSEDEIVRHTFWRCTKCGTRLEYRNAYCHAERDEALPPLPAWPEEKHVAD